MKLSTKSRYGVRALFDMSFNAGTLPVQIKDISRRQSISPRYLEQIFQDLKRAGLLKSKRGPNGGYFLSRKAEEITVADIIIAAEGDMKLVDCSKKKDDCNVESGCEFDNHCVTQTLWVEATSLLEGFFNGVTLKDLCDRAKKMGIEKELDHRFMYYI